MDIVNTNILDFEHPTYLDKRIKTGISFVDLVLNGGFVPSTVSMLSADPGAGKTTLLLQVADALTSEGHIVLFNTVEQSAAQVRGMATRLSLTNGFVFARHKDVMQLLLHAKQLMDENPGKQVFIFLDSLSKMAGGRRAAAQDIANKLIQYCQATLTVALFIVHVTKSGEFAGNNTMLHDIDTHLHMEVEDENDDDGTRFLHSHKNRFGKRHTSFLQLTEKGHVCQGDLDELEIEVDDDDNGMVIVFEGD